MTGKVIAQLGAAIGRQFAYDLLQAVSQLDEATLQRELGRLVEAEIVYQRGVPPHSTYLFKHALIQDAAVQSLLKSTRQGYHQRIAQVLEAQFAETAEAQPELLAHHYTEAGRTAQAVEYWYRAGQQAQARFAYHEVAGHTHTGLAMMGTLPETPARRHQELNLLLLHGAAQIALSGYASSDVAHTYARARELCQYLEEPHQQFPILGGLRNFHLVRAELSHALALDEEEVRLAQQTADPELLFRAHVQTGHTLFHLGELSGARTHFDTGLQTYRQHAHRMTRLWGGIDFRVFSRSWLARTVWLLGYPQQASGWNAEALALVRAQQDPFSRVATLLDFRATWQTLFRDYAAAEALQAEALQMATAQRFPQFIAIGTFLEGVRRIRHGDLQEGQRLAHDGLTAYRATGAAVRLPYYLSLLAAAYSQRGQGDTGVSVVDEALHHSARTRERWCDAELHRLKGELLLAQSPDNDTEAESCFHHAIRIAQGQHAKSWELRAATSLARLWQQQGKRQEAHDLLAPVYGWFTEGFDTADLQDAKALLDALG
jgi:predicted ATPase